jgi:hypothetical protein
VAERAGFRVSIDPFGYREGSNTVVLQARPRDAYSRAEAQPAVPLAATAG